jgi:hypothetical protein
VVRAFAPEQAGALRRAGRDGGGRASERLIVFRQTFFSEAFQIRFDPNLSDCLPGRHGGLSWRYGTALVDLAWRVDVRLAPE